MAGPRTQAEIDADQARYDESRRRHFADRARQQPQAQQADILQSQVESALFESPAPDQRNEQDRSATEETSHSPWVDAPRNRWEFEIGDQLRAHVKRPAALLDLLFYEALRHAKVDDRAQELVLDLNALVSSLLVMVCGTQVQAEPGDAEGTRLAADLQRWIEANVVDDPQPDPKGVEARWASAADYSATLSFSIRKRFLPALAHLSGDEISTPVHVVRLLAEGQVDPATLLASGWRAGPAATRELADLLDAIAARSGQLPGLGEGARAAKAREETPVLEDQPATLDLLGRKPVASVLADRLRAVWPSLERDGQALIVHLHGPWGSGKSSILNFLKADLSVGPSPWLVIEFNAWRNARVHPPWWSLVRETRRAVQKLGLWHWLRVQAVWLWWRIKMDWLVAVGALLLLAVLGGAAATGLIEGVDVFGKEGALSALAGVAGLVTAMLLLNRTLVLGSKGASDALDALRADAAGPVAELFCRLVKLAGRPVILYLDDLDRCAPQQVTDLLEGVQTLFRETACVFVAVGDRAWLCEAFELKYAPFSKVIGEPGRPMGYLFLDKLFQISVGVPAFTPAVRKSYLANLLGRDGGSAGLAPEAARAEIEKAGDHEAIAAVIKKAPEAEQPALRAAAAEREGSTRVQAEIEHRLEPLAGLMEANPRAMKQVVNAVGLNRARMWLEGREVPFEVLARFTILELRWPAVAAFLAADPARAGDARGWPEDFTKLLTEKAFTALLGQAGDKGRLDPDAIEALRGHAGGQS